MDHNNIEFEFVLRASCKISNFTDINNKKLKVIEIDNYDSLTAYQTWSGDTLFLNNRKRKVFGLDLDYFFNAVEMFNKDREYELQYRPTLVVRRQNSHSHHNSHTFLNVVSFNSYVNENKGDDEECNTCIGGFNLYRTFKIYCDNNFTHLDFSVDGEKINKELINTLEGETISLTINFSPLPYSDIDFLPGREYTPFHESAYFGETIKNKDTNMFSAASNTSIVTSLTSKEFPSVEGYPQKTFNFILKDHGKIIYKNRRKCIVIKNPKMIEAYQIWNKASKSIHQDRRILKYITGGELAAAASRINSYLFTGNANSSYSLFKFTPSAYLSIEGKEYYIVIDKIVHNSSTNNNEDGSYDMDVASELIFYLDELSFTYANGEILEEVPTFYTKKPIYINIDPTPDPSNINHNDTNNALSSLGYQVIVANPELNLEYLLPTSNITTISKSLNDEPKVRILPKQHVRGRNVSKNHSGPKKKPKQFKFDKKLFEEKKNVRRVKSRNVVYDSPQNVDVEVCPYPEVENLSLAPGEMTPCYHVKVMGSVDKESEVDDELNPPVFYLKPNTSDKYFKQPHLKLFKGISYLFDLSDPSLFNTSTNVFHNFQIFNGASFDSDDNLSPISHIRGGNPGEPGAYIIFTIQNTMYTYEDYSTEFLNFTYGNYVTSLDTKKPLYPNMGGSITLYSRDTIRKTPFRRILYNEDYDLPRLKPNPDPNDPNIVPQDGSDIKNFTISYMLSFLSTMIRDAPLLNNGVQDDNTQVEVQDVNSRSLGKPLTIVAKPGGGRLKRLFGRKKGRVDFPPVMDATANIYEMNVGPAAQSGAASGGGSQFNPVYLGDPSPTSGSVFGARDPADGAALTPIQSLRGGNVTMVPVAPGREAPAEAISTIFDPISQDPLALLGSSDRARIAGEGLQVKPPLPEEEPVFGEVDRNRDGINSFELSTEPLFETAATSIASGAKAKVELFAGPEFPISLVDPSIMGISADGGLTGDVVVLDGGEEQGGGLRLGTPRERMALEKGPTADQMSPALLARIQQTLTTPGGGAREAQVSNAVRELPKNYEQHINSIRWSVDGVLYYEDPATGVIKIADPLSINPEIRIDDVLDEALFPNEFRPADFQGRRINESDSQAKFYQATLNFEGKKKRVILYNQTTVEGVRVESFTEIVDPRIYVQSKLSAAQDATVLTEEETASIFSDIRSSISSSRELVVKKEDLLEILDELIKLNPVTDDSELGLIYESLKNDINSNNIEQFNYSFINLSDVQKDLVRISTLSSEKASLLVNTDLRPRALKYEVLGKIQDYSMLKDPGFYSDIEINFTSLMQEYLNEDLSELWLFRTGDSIELYGNKFGTPPPEYSISLSDVRDGVRETFSNFLSDVSIQEILNLANDLSGGVGINEDTLKEAYNQLLERYLNENLLDNINSKILRSVPQEKEAALQEILKPQPPASINLIDSSLSLLSSSKTFLDIQRKATYNVDLFVNDLVDKLTPEIGPKLLDLQKEWSGVREFTNKQVMEIRRIIEEAIRETPISEEMTRPDLTTERKTELYLQDIIERFAGNLNQRVAQKLQDSKTELFEKLQAEYPGLSEDTLRSKVDQIIEGLQDGANVKDFYSVVGGREPVYEEPGLEPV